MRKSKKTTATFDAIGSLTPEEAGALLSSDDSILNKTVSSVDLGDLTWIGGPDVYIGDPPGTLGGGSTSPYDGPTIVNPTIGGGIGSGTISTISVSDIEDRIKKLEEVVARLQLELAEAKKKGGFWRRPNI